ncbi:hypothetical protein BDD12DRAFT_907459 [Trichophaea hybrida]|nr:hypothetical protein BDD12DRAFT_907459 [Trichophaea hybrida]
MPRKGNKGLQKTLSTVVSSAFETPETLSVSVSSPEQNSVSTSPAGSPSSFAPMAITPTPSLPPSDCAILERLDKFDVFQEKVKLNIDNLTNGLQKNDKTRREQIATLQEEIGSLKNQVEELKTTVKNLLEEKSASAVATTPPPPPEKEKTIRPSPTPVVPLATQVLKRNLARKTEEIRKRANQPTQMKEQVEGRPSKTPRLVSPPESLMHSKHARGVVEDRKRKREDGRGQTQKSEERKKSESGWTEVKKKKRGPRGPSTKIDDSRGYTLVWDTPTGRYESWRPKGSHER